MTWNSRYPISKVNLWNLNGQARKWRLVSAGISLTERIFTFTYFIPTMINLMGADSGTDPEIIAKALQWESLNYIRHFLSFTAWLYALKAVKTL
ncbi:MAG: hypothetical protein ACOH5I_24985 [Oligoflexus sp.]